MKEFDRFFATHDRPLTVSHSCVESEKNWRERQGTILRRFLDLGRFYYPNRHFRRNTWTKKKGLAHISVIVDQEKLRTFPLTICFWRMEMSRLFISRRIIGLARLVTYNKYKLRRPSILEVAFDGMFTEIYIVCFKFWIQAYSKDIQCTISNILERYKK